MFAELLVPNSKHLCKPQLEFSRGWQVQCHKHRVGLPLAHPPLRQYETPRHRKARRHKPGQRQLQEHLGWRLRRLRQERQRLRRQQRQRLRRPPRQELRLELEGSPQEQKKIWLFVRGLARLA